MLNKFAIALSAFSTTVLLSHLATAFPFFRMGVALILVGAIAYHLWLLFLSTNSYKRTWGANGELQAIAVQGSALLLLIVAVLLGIYTGF